METAARARIEDQEQKAAMRGAYAMGEYHDFAKRLVWPVGAELARASGIGRGERVLDVAAGTGNFALRAAEAGAAAVASDLTPENFPAGQHEAADLGVELEWVEADAEALPFETASFDVVGSVFGAIFAPNHRLVAEEMLRVCRPGGRIAMANFTPEGLAAEFFGLFAPFMPEPPAGAQPPLLWGDEQHVGELLGEGTSSLETERRSYVERAESPVAYRDFFKRTFGPVTAIYSTLAGDAEATATLDRAFVEWVERADSGPPKGPTELRYEYLLVRGERG